MSSFVTVATGAGAAAIAGSVVAVVTLATAVRSRAEIARARTSSRRARLESEAAVRAAAIKALESEPGSERYKAVLNLLLSDDPTTRALALAEEPSSERQALVKYLLEADLSPAESRLVAERMRGLAHELTTEADSIAVKIAGDQESAPGTDQGPESSATE